MSIKNWPNVGDTVKCTVETLDKNGGAVYTDSDVKYLGDGKWENNAKVIAWEGEYPGNAVYRAMRALFRMVDLNIPLTRSSIAKRAKCGTEPARLAYELYTGFKDSRIRIVKN